MPKFNLIYQEKWGYAFDVGTYLLNSRVFSFNFEFFAFFFDILMFPIFLTFFFFFLFEILFTTTIEHHQIFVFFLTWFFRVAHWNYKFLGRIEIWNFSQYTSMNDKGYIDWFFSQGGVTEWCACVYGAQNMWGNWAMIFFSNCALIRMIVRFFFGRANAINPIFCLGFL